MKIFNSLYFRTKHYIHNEERKQVLKRNNLTEKSVEGVSQSMIEGLETIRNYVNQANILLDIGTHHGLFSKAANAFFNIEKTICFEPNSVQNEIISRNCSDFNHRIENVALSDSEGEVTFYLHQDETMNSIVESDATMLNEEFPYDNPTQMKETKVRTTTLDLAISRMNLTNPTFLLKIDTQGNELNVLSHGTEVLRRTEVCFIEYMFVSPYKNNFSFYELVGFMNAQGFDCKGALSIFKRPSKKVSAVDFLFVKRRE